MNLFSRAYRFAVRLASGADVVQVRQDISRWNQQYESGQWEHLKSDHPNTSLVAGMVLHMAQQAGRRLRVLDVGCGNGALALLLAPAFSNIEYYGYDVSQKAIDAAQVEVPNGTFLTASAEEPPEGLGTFNIILFHEVFYYLNPELVLRMHRKYAGPNTKLVISSIRSWRSPFTKRKIRRHVIFSREISVYDANRRNRFDVALGCYTPTHENEK